MLQARDSRLILTVLFLFVVLVAGCSDDPADPIDQTPHLTIGGTFVIDNVLDEINGSASTGVFNHLIGATIEFAFSFDAITQIQRFSWGGDLTTEVTTGPGSLVLTGDPFDYLDSVCPGNYEGVTQTLNLVDIGSGDCRLTANMMGETGDQFFGIQFGVYFAGTVDGEGYPELHDVDPQVALIVLRRYSDTGGFHMTDYATGPLTVGVAGLTEVEIVGD